MLCWLIAWLITNGWSYILFGVGTYLNIEWMIAVAGAYLTFLWLPISPEKIVTCAIAIALLRWLFPGDEKTLAVLRGWRAKAKAAMRSRRARKAGEEAAKERPRMNPTADSCRVHAHPLCSLPKTHAERKIAYASDDSRL